MAKLEVAEETGESAKEAAPADLLIAVAAPVAPAQLRVAAVDAMRGMAAGAPDTRLATVVAFPAGSEPRAESMDLEQTDTAGSLRFVPYPPASSGPSVIPWLASPATYRAIFAIARELGVRACAVVGFDLAALRADWLSLLVTPLLEKHCDLMMPVYPQGKFEGLLNSSILAPLPRALYGRRVRFPLAPDFALSDQMLQRLDARPQRAAPAGQYLFWPATEAAFSGQKFCQTQLNIQHLTATDGVDLSTVLAQTVGPLFADMEANAALWQRVRASQPVPTFGGALPPAEGATADVKPMLETFQLGFRNLQEVWSLVLPPVTLLELKRLTRMTPENFRMPDELWVRIVYDFALAYRLRTISRSHLLGALTPLYLGWVASYVLEVGGAPAGGTEHRLEKLARAYEDGKPYLLSRWRWPDRFNP